MRAEFMITSGYNEAAHVRPTHPQPFRFRYEEPCPQQTGLNN